jgi:hypothetical protein
VRLLVVALVSTDRKARHPASIAPTPRSQYPIQKAVHPTTSFLSFSTTKARATRFRNYAPNDGKSFANSPIEGIIRSIGGQGTYTPPIVSKLQGIGSALNSYSVAATSRARGPLLLLAKPCPRTPLPRTLRHRRPLPRLPVMRRREGTHLTRPTCRCHRLVLPTSAMTRPTPAASSTLSRASSAGGNA